MAAVLLRRARRARGTIVAAVLLAALPRSTSAQWEIVHSGVESSNHGIAFLNDSVGIAVGTGSVFRTTDRGLTWTRVDSLTFAGIQLEGVLFDSTEFGIVALAVGERLTIGRSTDLGRTWAVVHQDFNAMLRTSCRLPDGRFVAGGSGGWFARSSDTGLTWETRLIYPTVDLHTLVCNEQGTLWGSGLLPQVGNAGCCGVITRSEDAGESWEIVRMLENRSSERIETFATLNDSTIVALSPGREFFGRASIWRTVDGGETWEEMILVGDRPLAMDFFGEMEGVIVGELGLILWTEDGGETWVPHHNPIIGHFYDVLMLDEKTAIAVGDGSIIRTTAGAATSSSTDELPNGSLRHRVYPNPVSSVATIGFEHPDVAPLSSRLTVVDVLGRVIQSRTIPRTSGKTHSFRIEATTLPQGLYFYTIESEFGTATGSFVVAR